jgi:endosialidase-like protein
MRPPPRAEIRRSEREPFQLLRVEALGSNAGPDTDLSNTLALGSGATVSASNTIRLGNSSITHIYAAVGTIETSDARYKTSVRENVPGLAFINKLRPVTYHWDMKKLKASDGQSYLNSDTEKERTQYTGFLAQEVEAAARDCGFDFSGVARPVKPTDKYGSVMGHSTRPLQSKPCSPKL